MASDSVAKTRFSEYSDINFILSLLRRVRPPNDLSPASGVEIIHITPRATVSTDHGPLARNPLNNSSRTDEPGPVRESLVRERQS
jgi:hypothetical protein